MTDHDTIRVFPSPDDVANQAARLVAEKADEAIRSRGRFTIGLAGGSTPAATYAILARDYSDVIDWSKVFIFFGDERCVPPDHEDSNFRMAKEKLLDLVPIPESQVFRMEAEQPLEQAALRYEQTLRKRFPDQNQTLDLLLLGMGTDGHTASLFPGTRALNENDHWSIANHVPQLNVNRITLTYPFLNASRTIAFLVTGNSKSEMLAKVLSEDVNPQIRPSQGIAPTNGTLLWILDKEAAANLNL